MAASKPCDIPTTDELVSAQMARDLETAHAERDGAVQLVHHLAECLERQGGYMSPEDQYVMHQAITLAERYGLRKRSLVKPWSNRE